MFKNILNKKTKEPEWFLADTLYWYKNENAYNMAFAHTNELGESILLDCKTKQPIQSEELIKFCEYKFNPKNNYGKYDFSYIPLKGNNKERRCMPKGFYTQEKRTDLNIPLPDIAGWGSNPTTYKTITLKKSKTYDALPSIKRYMHTTDCPVDAEHVKTQIGKCRSVYCERYDDKGMPCPERLTLGIWDTESSPTLCFDDVAIDNVINYTNKYIQLILQNLNEKSTQLSK